MENRFVPLLLGADMNVYSMARAFHEAYGVKTVAYGMYPSGPCVGSAIIDYRVSENNDAPEVVLANVKKVAAEFADRKVILLGCGDNYLTSIACNLDAFPENVIAPYIDLATMEVLIHKEKFYELCDQYGIDHPATFVYKKGMGHDFTLPLLRTLRGQARRVGHLLGPPFDTQKKAYVLQTREEVDRVLDEIYEHGYEDSLIIQDFIPGDDSFMRVVTNYSGEDGKVCLMCVGHVLLEESTPVTASATTRSSSPSRSRSCAKNCGSSWRPSTTPAFPTLMSSSISGTGSSRSLRSTPARAGATTMSPARVITWPGIWWRARIEHKPCPLTVTKNRHMWRVIPRSVAYDYLSPRSSTAR